MRDILNLQEVWKYTENYFKSYDIILFAKYPDLWDEDSDDGDCQLRWGGAGSHESGSGHVGSEAEEVGDPGEGGHEVVVTDQGQT